MTSFANAPRDSQSSDRSSQRETGAKNRTVAKPVAPIHCADLRLHPSAKQLAIVSRRRSGVNGLRSTASNRPLSTGLGVGSEVIMMIGMPRDETSPRSVLASFRSQVGVAAPCVGRGVGEISRGSVGCHRVIVLSQAL